MNFVDDNSPVIGLHIRGLWNHIFAASSLVSFNLSVIALASASPAEARVLKKFCGYKTKEDCLGAASGQCDRGQRGVQGFGWKTWGKETARKTHM